MKTTLTVLFLSLLQFVIQAQEPLVFPDLRNPLMMVVDADRYYFADQYSVLVYDKKDNRLLHSLCREGQGPWEVGGTPGFCVTPQNVVIFDIPKVILFDKASKPVKEINLAISTSDWKQSVLADQIVYAQTAVIDGNPFNRIFLLDPESAEKKQLCQVMKRNFIVVFHSLRRCRALCSRHRIQRRDQKPWDKACIQ